MNPYYANNSRTTSQSSFAQNQSFNNNASQSSSQHSYSNSNQGTSIQGAATSSNVTNNYGTANAASRVSDVQPVNHGSSGNSSSLSHNNTQQQSQPKSVNPYAPRTSPSNPPAVTPATSKKGNGTSSQGMTSQTPSTVPSFPTTNNNNNNTTSSSPPDRGSESLSFSELRTRLLQMSQHQGLYEENWGKTFIVPCKLRTGSTVEENPMFNIQKVKKGKKCGKVRRSAFVQWCYLPCDVNSATTLYRFFICCFHIYRSMSFYYKATYSAQGRRTDSFPAESKAN